MISIKHIGVRDGAINDRYGRTIEESKISWKIWVRIQAKERVYVYGEWSTIVTQELDDGEHEAMDVRPEIPS